MRMPAALLLALHLALAAAPLHAASYHVAPPPLGSDANPGTEVLPWATLQRAADAVAPGDNVLVHDGTYAGFHLTTSGTPAARIAFAAAAGEQPLIDRSNPVTADGINLEGASYVTVQGFRISGVGRAGIRAVLCDEVAILDNIADQNGDWGILTGFCDDLLIEGNETSRSGTEHGIYVSNSGDRPVIRGNTSWGNNANGIHMNGDIETLDENYAGVLDGVISGALVEDNVIFGNGAAGGSGINCDGVQDSLIRNNLIFDQHASGISLFRENGGAPSTGNRVYNNTVQVASDGRWALNVQNGSSGNDIRNNILHSEHGFRGAVAVCASCLTGMASDNNAVEDRFSVDGGNSAITLAQWRSATGLDQDSLVATPAALFADAANEDYHLAVDSPAHDAGALLPAVPADIESTPRPQGATHDIGAYETPDPQQVFRDGFES